MNPIENIYNGTYPPELRLNGQELIIRVNGASEIRIKLREKTAAALRRALTEPSYTLVPDRVMTALREHKCLRTFCDGCEMSPQLERENAPEACEDAAEPTREPEVIPTPPPAPQKREKPANAAIIFETLNDQYAEAVEIVIGGEQATAENLITRMRLDRATAQYFIKRMKTDGYI